MNKEDVGYALAAGGEVEAHDAVVRLEDGVVHGEVRGGACGVSAVVVGGYLHRRGPGR